MIIECVWEHNGNDSMIYAANFIGAFSRGESRDIALNKIIDEVRSYLRWKNEDDSVPLEAAVVQEWASDLDICDADTDVIFDKEKKKLSLQEYLEFKELALKSAKDFLSLYESIQDKHSSSITPKNTFLGPKPRTAFEMYEHTKEVNSYYFGEIKVPANNDGTILECRQKGFELLESRADFLENTIYTGSFNEEWSLKKVLRRFIWHDRIHGKAMYRMAVKTFGENTAPDVFRINS